jgi:hypothetical protein
VGQHTQVGPCIPVGMQLQKAGVGPTSGPAWRLPHLGGVAAPASVADGVARELDLLGEAHRTKRRTISRLRGGCAAALQAPPTAAPHLLGEGRGGDDVVRDVRHVLPRVALAREVELVLRVPGIPRTDALSDAVLSVMRAPRALARITLRHLDNRSGRWRWPLKRLSR